MEGPARPAVSGQLSPRATWAAAQALPGARSSDQDQALLAAGRVPGPPGTDQDASRTALTAAHTLLDPLQVQCQPYGA